MMTREQASARLNKLKYRHFYCFDVNRVKSFMIYKMRVNPNSVFVCVCDNSVWTVFSLSLEKKTKKILSKLNWKQAKENHDHHHRRCRRWRCR